jgi:hypothetical protein
VRSAGLDSVLDEVFSVNQVKRLPAAVRTTSADSDTFLLLNAY